MASDVENGTSGQGEDHVPIERLIDPAKLTDASRGERELTAREIRALLPRGWVLDPDHKHAHRDVRLFFREGWILLSGLVIFGVLGGFFLWGSLPRGWDGVIQLGLTFLLIVIAGGIAGPIITKALMRKK